MTESPNEEIVRQHVCARRRILQRGIVAAAFNSVVPVIAMLSVSAYGTLDSLPWGAAPFGFFCGLLALDGWRSFRGLREKRADLDRFERYALTVFAREREEEESDGG